ncbi:MAG: DUF262 domain-containing protein [Flavobacteriaceae bacterium]
MSSQKAMQEVSVAELLSNYNLIVPEIQREYVWGFNNFNILDIFIQDIKEGFTQNSQLNQSTQSEIETLKKLVDSSTNNSIKNSLNSVIKELEAKKNPLNIGFLYSYRPDYYVFNDRNEDLYLIDGQQRFTTLFLILFYLSIREGKREDFLSTFRFNRTLERVAFDYRVRTLTHSFFIDLLDNISTLDDLLNIKQKNWFLSNYGNDTTVNAIVGLRNNDNSGVFQKLQTNFEKDSEFYYEFVKTQIKFWHFKTEETSQGEELYITMNSRGQQLADNETIRAKLFDTDTVKANPLIWSEKWEIWQDFFWKHRDNQNSEITADEGLNEFLRWIQIMKMTELKEVNVEDENEDAFDKQDILEVIKWGHGNKVKVEYLSLVEIENYFQALVYLYESFPKELEPLKANYQTYRNFNLLDEKWLCPTENNNSIVQIDSFRFLPILYYCKTRLEKNESIDTIGLFRLIRFLKNLSEDTTISKTAGIQTINALKMVHKLDGNKDIVDIIEMKDISTTILNNEERIKLQIIKATENRFRIEDLFWKAEDHKQNRGSILHLINFTEPIPDNRALFNIDDFEQKLIIYNEFLEKKSYIWGNLIATNVYNENFDRINYTYGWHKKEDFLELVSARQLLLEIGLKEFLIQMQKSFVRNYNTVDEVKNETSFKKQIYLYYILQFNDLIKNAPKWEWGFGWNFGAYSNFAGYQSLFQNKIIFQFFDVQFRENEAKLLWIHKHLSNKNQIVEKLLNWSKE